MFRRMFPIAIAILLGMVVGFQTMPASAQKLELNKQDRICILGNTLADRMQHDGWFEAAIHDRFPEHELFIRNLGFSGDQLTQRLRSMNFGTPDDHLTHNKANVIFLMFGFNESFLGEAGLEKFKEDLTNEVKHLGSQKYDGKSNPRIVIFSPISFENHEVATLPDGEEENARLGMYTAAAEEVAQANGLPFVDLFSTTKLLYSNVPEKMTINGVHLNELGNMSVARIACNRLFGRQEYGVEQLAKIESIRQKVIAKNVCWYNYYRATDGYSQFGGRAALKFTDGQTNRDVMKREMEILDMMSANRDVPIWAAAQNSVVVPDDSNLPPFVDVVTNKRGQGPDGQHIFLSGEEAISKMRVEEGIEVTLFASEKTFPEMTNPVQMSFDSKGRLWVATWHSYPHWKPNEKMSDKLLILTDKDGDGKADECKVFADGLHNPTGFEFYGDGVMLAHQPDIMYLEDTDGDDVCDVRKRVLHGLGSADTHHAANSFVFGPGGALYFQEGTFHRTQSETPYGPTWMLNGGSYRFEPKTFRFEVYTSQGFANPHGHVFDQWGRDIIHDGTGSVPYDGALSSGKLPYPDKHPRPPVVYNQRTRPCPATEWLDSSHFPEAMRENLLVLNVIGDLGILRYKITDEGAGMKGEELKPLLLSDDPNFRPVDIETAPDGTLYILDWQNPIIGHMQHNLRDPSRDRDHGRVYQIKMKGGPLVAPVAIDGEPIPKLLDVLKHPEKRVRYRARIELYGRDGAEVKTAIENWLPGNRDNELARLEMLWMLQAHNIYHDALMTEMLNSSNPRIRAASTRVLCGLRDLATSMKSRLVKLAGDENARVRMEAVRTASFLSDNNVKIAVVATAAGQPMDKYLSYVVNETQRTVGGSWKSKVVSTGLMDGLNSKSAEFVLNRLSNSEVLALPMTDDVASHLIYRGGIEDSIRAGAIQNVAKQSRSTEVNVLLDSLEKVESKTTDKTVVNDLVRMLSTRTPGELKSVRSRLGKMATTSALPAVRRIGYIGMMLADQNSDSAWEQASASPTRVLDFIAAVPLVPDQALQSKLYSRLEPLMGELPESLGGGEGSDLMPARFVRIELPGKRRILTLAEVKVLSNGRNLARSGKATQSSVAHGGTADLAIDGNTNPDFSKRSQTHTVESSDTPWWEVDLKGSFEVEQVEIFNRVEGKLGERLKNFTLQVLDADRKVIFEKVNNPAPATSVAFEVDTISPATKVNRSAIDAISYLRGYEAKAFGQLADVIVEGKNRTAAVRSIQRVPLRFWKAERADEILKTLVGDLEILPVADRTSPSAISSFQLAQSLTGLLPETESVKYDEVLGELGVLVVSVGTRPHRMAYDRDAIVVPSGKQVQLIFENTDMMPHNIVITKPGMMEKVGLLAENTSQQRGAFERHYVPDSSDVLFSGKLIQPLESETITFQTPTKPGVYAYVCTYPGHWRRMYGKLIVVESPREYRANPEKYLAENGIKVLDEMLQSDRTKTEWKMADFDNAFPKEYFEGRNFQNGKQMFTLSSCISCHKMGDEGYAFGPEFKDLDPEWTAKEVLSHIIEPSKKIDDKYKTQTLLLETGSTVAGIVTFEDDDTIKLVENPMEASKEIKIDKVEVEGRKRSDVSIMPLGLLDPLTREEILDLLAYVMANGDKDFHLFKDGEHDH
jgi:putative heme-binding domain-containing protein